jgi:hypothetical protein
MAGRRITLRVQPPMPFGDVTMVPATLSGRPEADMARAMTAAFADVETPSAADVFKSPTAVLSRGTVARTGGGARRHYG